MHSRLIAVLAVLAMASPASAQVTVRSGSGASPAAIVAVRDQFRTDLGGGTTPGAGGSFGGLRREINWDGVPAASATPNAMALDFFNVTSPRGVVFSTPGTGVHVSAGTSDPSGSPIEFGNFNPAYVTAFQSFSPQRLFSPVGSNIFDVQFFLPGTNVPAEVTGFGLVLTDVDVAGATTVRLFNANGTSIAVLSAPTLDQGLSFVGGLVGPSDPRIARVRITLGNAVLGAVDNNAGTDVVVTDDFIYGEPSATSLFNNGFE